jgi:hypothetical protein
VLLDRELAALYGVTTARLNQQVRRNDSRFPADFLFELTAEEVANLKLHFATSSWGGRRTLPLAFTEHGAIMAATVLKRGRGPGTALNGLSFDRARNLPASLLLRICSMH